MLLLDGDLFSYRSAASCNPTKDKPFQEPLEAAIKRVDSMLTRVLEQLENKEYKLFLSGEDNYRYRLNSNYKANRKDKPRPQHLEACREHLVTKWGAKVTYGYEADDAIGMSANKDSIIVSNDKDFLQIQGKHYNPVTDVYREVNDYEAQYNFWMLMLQGDTSDNIRGLEGMGPVKAARILAEVPANKMFKLVYDKYDDDKWFWTNYYLLKILRSEEDLIAVEDYIEKRALRALDRMARDAEEWGLYDE